MLLFVLLAICLFGRPAEAQYGGGTGEPNDPYLIYTAEQMNAIGADANDRDKHFKLTADIDLSAFTGTSFNIIGTDWDHPFTGVFDGNGHTISSFTYDCNGVNDIGLFGYIDDPNAEIKDLGLIDPNIDAGTGNSVGSLVGYITDGTISNCYVEGGSVAGDWGVGGLVGDNYDGIISNCYVEGGSVSGNEDVGGLVGWNKWGTISDCYSSGTVSGNEDVGGLVGENNKWGTISDCYSSGTVSGNNYVGGLVGWNYWYGYITNCYSAGGVTGNEYVGGLVGDSRGVVTVSFWDIEISGQSTSAGGTGKTTAEMQTASTFLCWGYEPIWMLDEGTDYPRLWWENKPGELLRQLSDFLAGAGTQDDPYLIYTAEQLNLVGLVPCDWDKHFKLMADIDLSAYTGTAFNIIGTHSPRRPFTGVFDGNGYTISNFSYTSTDVDNIGLFGYVKGENAQIKDLGLIDPNVDAGTGWDVGSLVARNSGTITNCYSSGSVSGDRYVGNLVGRNDDIITNCYAGGSVSGDRYVAGLVGANEGRITNCSATSTVSGMTAIGGLVGYNRETINDCYATGSVMGYSYVGGLVGYNRETINDCYTAGSVTGDRYVGGLLGDNLVGRVTDSFWDIEASGQILGVGLGSDAGISGKTTAEMQTESTFTDAGWDFLAETVNGTEDIWWILEGQDYPRLTWELIEHGSTALAENWLAGASN